MKLKPWADNIDPTTIPDEVLLRERARRNGAKRKSYTGGVVWASHNADVPGCRCAACIERREKASQQLETVP